jgi:glyoxylase-like metal-dependent hydrolase (beta-lactamase superfamily II)
MKIKPFVFNDFAVNSFVIYDDTKECVIIDPGCLSTEEQNTLKRFISENQLKPVKLLNTHCHVDHVAGNRFVSETYQIPSFAHEGDAQNFKDAYRAGQLYGMSIPEPLPMTGHLKESEVVRFGASELKVFHLPGHSKGSVGFWAQKEKFVVVGDVLFNGSVGRTDLNGGSLDELMHSIKNVLFKLDDDVVVYSGHGPETSIGNELRSNPFLLDNVM